MLRIIGGGSFLKWCLHRASGVELRTKGSTTSHPRLAVHEAVFDTAFPTSFVRRGEKQSRNNPKPETLNAKPNRMKARTSLTEELLETLGVYCRGLNN